MHISLEIYNRAKIPLVRGGGGGGVYISHFHITSVLINQFVPQNFCLCFTFTGINFRGMLHHVCDVAYDENMCGPIRTSKWRSAN